MKEIIFATNNLHKLQEINQIIAEQYKVLSLSDIGFKEEIPETAPTIEGNALQKASFIYERFQLDCFADDTGLEVDALDGAPGVYSARYAGANCSYSDNVNKLLEAMQGVSTRKARFKTVIACFLNGKTHTFEGIVNGQILTKPQGGGGFGYDPVFLPDGFDQSFAEMPAPLKNSISHRGIAVRKLVAFLKQTIS
jgi:XTP/dITP diphosphohydrolase